MSRKILLRILLGILVVSAGLVLYKHTALAYPIIGPPPYQYPCSVSSLGAAPCAGYFTGNQSPIENCGYACIPEAVDVLTNGLYNITNTSEYYNALNSDLSGANGGQDQEGAAFIVDAMLGHNTFNTVPTGSGAPAQAAINAGINYAISHLPQLNTILTNFQTQAANPGSGYSINWSYMETCQTNENDNDLNSAYFGNLFDDAFHNWVCTGPGSNGGTLDNGPAIVFSWPGGSFSVGSTCGNLENSTSALPSVPPTSPSGSIKVTCEVSNPDDYQVYVTFSDPSFPTTGTIATSGWNGNNPYSVRSGSTTVVTANSPYASQPVYLYVADDGSTYTYTANTQSCVTFACNPTVTPSVFDPYTPFQVQVAVTNSANQAPPGTMNMQLNISPQNGGSYSYNSSQAVVNNSATFSNLGPTHSSGEYSVTATITGTYSTHCATSFSVSNLPYLQIFGGDTITGASPTSASGQCSEQSAAGVYSWNNGTPNFSGAGDQYAVQAVGQIEDFASAQKSSPPTGLSFANTTGVTQSQGLFGGDFGAYTSDCNFTSDLSGITQQAGSSVTVPSSVSGTVDIYASGNVYIKNNVIYSGLGSWTTPSQIPDFRLVVVGGNIYVDSSVTELDGLYVAESNGTTGGTIYTCATGGLPSPAYGPTGAANAIANYYQTCNKQLKIYGSFVAQKVEFLRTYGTVGQATSSDTATSNHSAEVFDYTPEMWLPRGTGTPNSGYTAITGLPPVL